MTFTNTVCTVFRQMNMRHLQIYVLNMSILTLMSSLSLRKLVQVQVRRYPLRRRSRALSLALPIASTTLWRVNMADSLKHLYRPHGVVCCRINNSLILDYAAPWPCMRHILATTDNWRGWLALLRSRHCCWRDGPVCRHVKRRTNAAAPLQIAMLGSRNADFRILV